MYNIYEQKPANRNVVIYARVSTEHEAQLSALENQKDWYKPILQQHPEWNVIRMYVDEGITGTSAKKRPQFMKMIEDASYGEFNLILTREVSRFARNTVDTLQYTRDLKTKGVEVFFLNDNIKTFDGDGELRLTIMATLAQDESRKTSVRVKSGQQTSMNNGVFYGNGNILGYDRVGKEMIINPEQAKTVRMIYDWYLDGWGMRKIQFELEKAGRLTAMGKPNWHASNISKILQNSFYCGIITYHKEFTPDFLEQKKIRNFGDVEFTQVRGTHEPIITEEEYNRVQKMMESRRRKQTGNPTGRRALGEKQPGDVWTKLLICECGHQFNRKTWHNTSEGKQYGYQCYSSIRTGTVRTRLNKGLSIDGICQTPMIAGWKLQMMAKYIFKNYLSNTEQVLALAESMLNKHINDKEEITDNTDIINQKKKELQKLSTRLDNLIEMRADGEIARDIFISKKKDIEDRIFKLNNEIKELSPEVVGEYEDASHEEKITILKYALEQYTNFNAESDIPESVIEAFVKKIVARKDGFDWYLRFDPDGNPKNCYVDGKRKKGAKVSSFCSPQHRLLLTKVGNSSFVKVHEYVIDLKGAKTYLYAYSTKHRILRWEDICINIYM